LNRAQRFNDLNIREGLLFRDLELLNPFGKLRACLEPAKALEPLERLEQLERASVLNRLNVWNVWNGLFWTAAYCLPPHAFFNLTLNRREATNTGALPGTLPLLPLVRTCKVIVDFSFILMARKRG
jgi:hypothetical protein